MANQVQFSEHAIERVLNRMASVTNYGEVQTAVAAAPVKGRQVVDVKDLGRTVEITDPTADTGRIRGAKVVAFVHSQDGGVVVDTVCLRD